MEQYQGSAILEVQARSCEYSHMFKLDGMRAALLEHIPPLDESTYTRNLGNSQVLDAAAAAQVPLSTWSAAHRWSRLPGDARDYGFWDWPCKPCAPAATLQCNHWLTYSGMHVVG